MDPLFLCWMFDSRWLCGLKNPCYQYALLVPILIDTATFIYTFIIKFWFLKIDQTLFINLFIIFMILLVATNLFLLIKISSECKRKLQNQNKNLEAIKPFIHNMVSKKNIWSWISIVILMFSIGQVVLNRILINQISNIINPVFLEVKFYFDIASWIIIAAVILIFLLSKLIYICLAWKNPESYLKFRSII